MDLILSDSLLYIFMHPHSMSQWRFQWLIILYTNDYLHTTKPIHTVFHGKSVPTQKLITLIGMSFRCVIKDFNGRKRKYSIILLLFCVVQIYPRVVRFVICKVNKLYTKISCYSNDQRQCVITVPYNIRAKGLRFLNI